jgi:WD repeat-containing protein mio
LNSKLISLEDRIAFACTYLSDKELIDYLQAQFRRCCEEGDYEGLVITGLGPSAGCSIGLLQRCIDIKQDIQTAALLVCRSISASPTDVVSPLSSESVWLHEYRQLLNRWCEWEMMI